MAGNAVLAVCKGGAFLFSGSGAMFASAMHSLADAINQGFVFVGSVLSEKNLHAASRPDSDGSSTFSA